MLNLSYADVFSIELKRTYDEEIRVGDLVATSGNSFPYFKVLAVHGDKAWLRNVQNEQDGFAALDRCRKVNGAPAAEAKAA
jgi:hypothetical protein